MLPLNIDFNKAVVLRALELSPGSTADELYLEINKDLGLKISRSTVFRCGQMHIRDELIEVLGRNRGPGRGRESFNYGLSESGREYCEAVKKRFKRAFEIQTEPPDSLSTDPMRINLNEALILRALAQYGDNPAAEILDFINTDFEIYFVRSSFNRRLNAVVIDGMVFELGEKVVPGRGRNPMVYGLSESGREYSKSVAEKVASVFLTQ